MRVVFLRDFRSWRRGETVCVSPVTGRAWLDAGIVELVGDGGHVAPVEIETAVIRPPSTAVLPVERGRQVRQKGPL